MSLARSVLLVSLVCASACGDDSTGDPVDASSTLDSLDPADAATSGAGDASPGSDAADNTAPTFAGLVSATALGPTTVRLTWMPATDDTTASLDIVYRVYAATTAGGQTLATPTTSSPTGATQMIVDLDAAFAGATAFFVVRAEDQAGNLDQNTVERSVMLEAQLSFATHIAPLLAQSCAGNGCHGGGQPKEGLSLAANQSYGDLVGVDAAQCGDATLRVTANDADASYLVRKMRGVNMCAGNVMPPSGALSAAEIQMVVDWITAGAPNN